MFVIYVCSFNYTRNEKDLQGRGCFFNYNFIEQGGVIFQL